MKKILILAGRYLPGHKDGGPLRTLINLTDALCNEYEFFIACYDRDHGDTEPYKGIQYNTWNIVGNAKVWYVPEGQFSKDLILKLAADKDSIYLTGFFEPYGYNTLLLKKEGKIKAPVALASMGVFSKGALSHKTLKKKIFINGCRLLGLFKNITWSGTSELEVEDIKREIGTNIQYIIAEDIPRTTIPAYSQRKEPFSVAFLSRICPQKNLMGAIQILKLVKANVCFYIYGPDQDKGYWEQCKKDMKRFSSNITWKYCGDVPSEEVQDKLSQHDVFLLPTMGENYGHVIFEALSVGCIPVISDQTPWNEIKGKNAGFIFPLAQLDGFARAIDMVAQMNPADREQMALNAVEIARDKVEKNRKETGYRKIFG